MTEPFDLSTWKSRVAAWWREAARDLPGTPELKLEFASWRPDFPMSLDVGILLLFTVLVVTLSVWVFRLREG